jgi:hypothetical protein
MSGQYFVVSLPELVARLLRELHTAQRPHSLRKQYHSQCGGWWMVSPPRCASVRERYVRDPLRRSSRMHCTGTGNNRNTPSAPAKWTVCTIGTLLWGP